MVLNKIYNMDCIDGLKMLDDQSVNTCVTSPPYYRLRDYGVPGQIGLEKTPEEFIEKLVEVFREVRRVLRDDGTLWINMGDSYAANSGKAPPTNTRNKHGHTAKTVPSGLKPKDLMGIPWMLAFALRADGWYLRQDIIWAKPNPMPESVKDRCTKSHEYIFLLSKSGRYYYDAEAIKEPCVQNEMANGFRGGAYCGNETFKNDSGGKRKNIGNLKVPTGWDKEKGSHGTIHRTGRTQYGEKKHSEDPIDFNNTKSKKLYEPTGMRNKRDVWTVSTQGFTGSHFATFPPKLIEPCILAGSPVGGTVLDPFMGSGTTAMIAEQLQRKYIGFELNGDYIKIADKERLDYLQIRIV